ncbi:hypothetical protein AVEN_129016-1 [Araneus ventricosus]|uniref:Mos1 transposase HTH domain-containing protein n=1 Tax=Araneus ventricosus TaxID=182803 RepID=A0A4Y2JA57_ARAVE|nr:hypothetical protein AVEN_129016-1 [Araneus ventricosus]
MPQEKRRICLLSRALPIPVLKVTTPTKLGGGGGSRYSKQRNVTQVLKQVGKWVRQFNDGRTNVHDEARSGRPSVVNDGLVAKVNEKIRENRRSTIRMLFDEFPRISKTVLHENVTSCLNYRKLCSRRVPNMLTDVRKTKRLGSALKNCDR